MDARAVLLILLCATSLRAQEDPWTVPDPKGIVLFVKLQQNPTKAYTVVPSGKVAPGADGAERVEPPVSPADKEALAACRELIAAAKHDEASARLAELLKENPANHDAHVLLALSLHQRGDDKAALAELREAIVGNRRDPEAWKLLEQVAKKLGKRVVRPKLKLKGWIEATADGGVTLGYADAGRDADMPWFYYVVARASYRYEGGFQRDHPAAKEYVFTFREQLFAFGAALNAAEAAPAAKRSQELKLLIAEKKAKTLVPFLFFAAYPEPLPQQPERDWESLKPVLEKYFDQKIIRS